MNRPILDSLHRQLCTVAMRADIAETRRQVDLYLLPEIPERHRETIAGNVYLSLEYLSIGSKK